MPLTVSLSVNKKIGLPAYSSLGASCHVELELESSLLQNDRDRFFRHVREAYAACASAVEEQLRRGQDGNPELPDQPPAAEDACTAEDRPASPPGNGHSHPRNPASPVGSSNGHASLSPQASSRQLGFARQLATQIEGLGLRRLDGLAERLVGKPLANLLQADAAVLIETLKNLRSGTVDLAELLEDQLP